MRVLQVHNKYRPGWGGEDTVADIEADLLRRNGHDVARFSAWTRELDAAGPLRLLGAGLGAVWSPSGYSGMKKAIAGCKPDVVHVHNDFPLLSPSIFWACSRSGVPVVQTMHNYRFTCADALLLREGRPCEECVDRFPWSALRHRCYGPSLPRTAAIVARNVIHRAIGTYRRRVQAFIVLTEFSKELLVRAGLPSDRVFVKPNFQSAPAPAIHPRLPQFVFSGWMTQAKGLHVLMAAWKAIHPAGQRLLLLGDGPERANLEKASSPDCGIHWCGAQPREKVLELVSMSRYVVTASLAYENFPMTVLEALAAATPVIAPAHGAFSAMVSDGREGLLFSPGEAASLETALRAAIAAPESVWMQWSVNARNKFLREYTEQRNYVKLMAIYDRAISCFQAQRSRASRHGLNRSVASAAPQIRGDS